MVVVLGLILVWQLDSSLSLAQPATPEAATAAPIASEVLGRAVPPLWIIPNSLSAGSRSCPGL